jgi:hypothetical protein
MKALDLPKKEKKRPAWWTPDLVLERLQDGHSAAEISELAAAEVGLKVGTLRAELERWKASLTYGARFREALELKGNNRDDFTAAWWPRFFEAMDQEGGDFEKACLRADIKPRVILALCDPKSRHYDKEFAAQYRLMEGDRHARIRGNLLRQAEAPDASGGKLAQKVLEAALPHQHLPPQKLEISGAVAVGVLTPEVLRAAAERADRLVRDREPKQVGSGSAS